jgi:hypothetical protein
MKPMQAQSYEATKALVDRLDVARQILHCDRRVGPASAVQEAMTALMANVK